MTNKLVASLLASVLLIISLLAGSGASQSLRVTEQPQDGDTPGSALTFSIELNVRVLYQIHHSRMIVVFVEPQSFTLPNITSLARGLSEAHTSEESLAIWFIGDKELLAETLKDLGEMIKPFSFGSVLFPKGGCALGYKAPPLYAVYSRSNSREDLRYYPQGMLAEFERDFKSVRVEAERGEYQSCAATCSTEGMKCDKDCAAARKKLCACKIIEFGSFVTQYVFG